MRKAQLLRLLEGTHTARVIATSNRELADLVERGALRSDLFYRIDVYPVHVPALRERREDLGALADTLLTRIATGLGRTPAKMTGSALAALEAYDWPGNVRELANLLERAVIRARTPSLRGPTCPCSSHVTPRRPLPFFAAPRPRAAGAPGHF